MSKITTIVFILFGLYVGNSVYVIYNLFHVPACHGNSRKCLRPHGVVDNKLEVSFKFTFSRYIYVAFAFNTQGLWLKLVKLLLASRLLLGEILFLGVIEIIINHYYCLSGINLYLTLPRPGNREELPFTLEKW